MKKIRTNKTDSLSDHDVERIGNILENTLNNRLAPLATKQDIKETKEELKEYINEGIQSVLDGMDNLSQQLAEKEWLDRIEKWTREIAQKVGVNLI